MSRLLDSSSLNGSEIAIIGLAGRFPGAKSVDEFWENLRDGVESISFFSDEEVLASGVDATVLSDPKFVKAGAVLDDADLFDADFFGFSPREAEITDPQHRLFLECAWEALENAGYHSTSYNGSIGVYAGPNSSNYSLNVAFNLHATGDSLDPEQLNIALSSDFLTTRVSYKLNLEGPSFSVQTACSTSLVAVHLACQSLLNGECDTALAGGVSVSSSRNVGHFYREGGIKSPDGHCRTFDAKSQGTIRGEGVGIVVLKRLDDALADGDFIHAVIKGSAINNDGSLKVSYSAPRIDGQAKAIKTAQVVAEILPQTISYVEAHGTATSLGDPIEIAALTQAFRSETDRKNFCAVGSVKTNVGHLGAAAGVTGLIKTVLALKHKQIPPSLHFENPNPKIDFKNSPFYVNTSLAEWTADGAPRRAGVSSFGMGGTNAHVVLEEAPLIESSGPSRPWQLLLLSARTSSALESATANLLEHFHRELNLADVAYTLKVGRKAFDYRRILVCQDIEQAKGALETLDSQQVLTQLREPGQPSVVFMFSGQGAQYVAMARDLYRSEPTFAEQVNNCCELLRPHLGVDLRRVLYPASEQLTEASEQLQQTAITQPALFIIEYALAQLWAEWGVHPTAMIGHSIGEYVAATLAGVFSLEDALMLVCARGKLMQQLPAGSMLAVPLSEAELRPLIGPGISVAAINSPSTCVVSGPAEAIAALENQLSAQALSCRRLYTSHAFHSQMMEPILEAFTQRARQVNFQTPQIPYISNITGTWITVKEATSPSYWADHLRHTVRWSDGLRELLKESAHILLEIGPGRTLTTLARQHPDKKIDQIVLSSVRHPKETVSDSAFVLKALGQLWLAGVEVDWSGFYAHEQRHRLALPTYPFERQRYWIESPQSADTQRLIAMMSVERKLDIADWFYAPCWKQSIRIATLRDRQEAQDFQKSRTLIFIDEYGVGEQLREALKAHNHEIVTVRVGDDFIKVDDDLYELNPSNSDGYDLLFKELLKQQRLPDTVIHLWNVTPAVQSSLDLSSVESAQEVGFYSLLFLAQALSRLNLSKQVAITVVSSNMQSVTGEEFLSPEKATLLGPINVISQASSHINCRSVDVFFPDTKDGQKEKLKDQLLAELGRPISEGLIERVVALRGSTRWVRTFEPVRLEAPTESKPARLREAGVYLITGGLGGIGLTLAKHLARTINAKLILTGRSALPTRDEWASWVAAHDATDSISRKIQSVQELEELGSEVLVISADVANLTQMTDAIAQIQSRFGQIHGVIHAAGVPGGGVIQLKTSEEAQNVLAPKITGTLVLETLFKNVDLDFLILCSSMSSVLGGFSQIDYAGANAFLDAFSHYRNSRKGAFTLSIDWGAWQAVGMAANAEFPEKLQELRASGLQKGILPEEGADAFTRLLGSVLPKVLVSPTDFLNLLERYAGKQDIDGELLSQFETAVTSKSKHPRPKLSSNYVSPRNDVEQQLADIWQDLLGIEQIGIDDNFFELGGDSLLALQVISRVYKLFHTELSIDSLFSMPTVASISKQIKSPNLITSKELSFTIPALDERETIELPTSFAQQRLWFLQQLEPESSSYNENMAMRLTGQLDVAVLERSLNEIVRRHTVLRTMFKMVEGRPVQFIVPKLTLTLPIVDLCGLLKTSQEIAVQRLFSEWRQGLFDLTQVPLLKLMLLKLGPQEYLLLLSMHHIIADGWSLGIFSKEISILYDAFSNDQTSPLPELPIQYVDFAVWQRQWLQGDLLETQLSYWQHQLAGSATSLNLQKIAGRPPLTTKKQKGAVHSFVISTHLSKQIKALGHQEGTTLFMTLLAVFQILLYRYTNQNDIVVGTDVAGRNRAELEPLIGFFINLLVLRSDLSGNPTFRELLERVRKVTLGAYAHQDLPFAKLVESLRPDRAASATPLFQVLFVLQNTPTPVVEFSGLTLASVETNAEKARFDLALFVRETEQGIVGNFRYRTSLFDAEAIARFSQHFHTLLQSAVQDPNTRIDSLEMLSESEKQQQIAENVQHEKAQFKRFKAIKPKTVTLPQKELVKTGHLQFGQTLPYVIQPDSPDIDLADWAINKREFIETSLLKYGAILFRGFKINAVFEFEAIASAICPQLFGNYGDLPREGISNKVYGSTPYPSDQAILFHNESSHLHQWPLKIWFFCVQPAQQGGETPIVDCRKVYQLLDSQLRARFEQKQLMYVRNYIEGLDVRWQDFFQTTDKTIVENHCRQSGIDCQWLPKNQLRTRKVRPAISQHPKTGEWVFFNQVQLHHVSCLEPAVKASLLSTLGEDNLPRNVYYGDGSPIEDSVIAEVGEIYEQAKISFPWEQGDILMLDNMLTAHGRNPYLGSRKIVVAMGEMTHSQNVQKV